MKCLFLFFIILLNVECREYGEKKESTKAETAHIQKQTQCKDSDKIKNLLGGVWSTQKHIDLGVYYGFKQKENCEINCYLDRGGYIFMLENVEISCVNKQCNVIYFNKLYKKKEVILSYKVMGDSEWVIVYSANLEKDALTFEEFNKGIKPKNFFFETGTKLNYFPRGFYTPEFETESK